MMARASFLDLKAFGVSFRLGADSDELLERMRRCAPLGAEVVGTVAGDCRNFAVASRGSAAYCLIVDDEVVGEDVELGPILDQLARDLMVHVADHAADRVFVHAGVVGWQGKALILPGTSFAGKTTLVAELVRAGAIYYSDEYAVLDERGWVHPYARDLQMREADGTEQRPVTVAELEGNSGAMALPVAQVVFTEYVEGGRWSPERMSAGMAALEMMRHAIPVQRTPARVMATLAKVMETATAVRSARGDATETAAILLAAMATGNP